METPAPSDRVRFDAFVIDRRAGEIRKHGLRVRLQRKPFQILEMLLDHPGELVTREELRARLWPADTFVDFDAGLNTAINKVRSALGDRAGSPRFVETVGRSGYRFIGAVDASPAPRVEPGTDFRRRAIAAALALSAFGLSAVLWRMSRSGPGTIDSIAVLPLANLSNDPGEQYFADGVTDALITDLASIRELKVISRQSAMRYRGSGKPLPEIARELNVDAIVEGSVVRSGGRVRVTAQLVYGPTDRHLWARDYERDLGDLLTLQGEVARTIAQEIRVALTEQERARLTPAHTPTPEVYDLYLRGRYFWNKRNEDALKKALEYFEQAVARDPGFALGYAAVTETYGPLGYGGYLSPAEVRPRMRAAALRALELDDGLAEAHSALATWLAFYDWSWTAAEKEYRRAIDLNPNYFLARQWYGLLLGDLGRPGEALEQMQKATELDPLNLAASTGVAVALRDLGREDDAMRWLHDTLELDPGFVQAQTALASGYLRQGRCPEALAELQKTVSANTVSWRLGYAYAACGRTGEARRELAMLERRAAERFVPALDLASVYAALGERARAFASLETAFDRREPALSRVRADDRLTSLHADPRFAALLRRMNLPPL